MFGNGVKTGTEAIVAMHRLILQVLRVGLTAWVVAVAGTATQGIVARRFVPATCPTSASTLSVSALSFPSNNLFLKSSKLKHEIHSDNSSEGQAEQPRKELYERIDQKHRIKQSIYLR